MSDGTQGAPPNGAGEDAPKYVTEEQLNRAITGRLSDFSKKFEKTLETSFGGLSEKLMTQVGDLITQKVGETKKPDDSNTPKGAEDPMVRGLQKQLEAVQKEVADAKRERDEQVANAKALDLRSKVQAELTKAGFTDAERARMAMGHLIDVDKRIRRGEDDSIVGRDIQDDQDVDLSTFVRSWVKSDEAKIFLPPKGAAGSGGRGGPAPKQGEQQPRLGELLANVLGGR